MADKAGKKQAKTGNSGRFKKNDPRIQPGPGRSAGYKTWAAEIYANMLDSPASAKDSRPFAIAAMEKYKAMVLAGKQGPMMDFIGGLTSFGISNLDAVLAGQKNQDKSFLRYQIRETLFDEQAEVFHCSKSTQVIVCGRRAGKTTEMAGDGVSVAVTHEEGKILYMGATIGSVTAIIWPLVIGYLKLLRVPYKENLTDHIIKLPSGFEIWFAGYHNRADVEKLRGHNWWRVYIDEASICPSLKYLKEEIIEPALTDRNGIMKIYGTPPRVKGTFFEALWNEAAASKNMRRFCWDMSVNIHMPGYEDILERIRIERNWKETDQVYLREYLGRMGVYDEDALVYRMTDQNYFTKESLAAWVKDQPPSDMYFVAGLDFGHTDADAFAIILGSRKRKESFLVYEYKMRGTGLGPLVEGIRAGLAHIKAEFPLIPQSCPIFADMGAGGAKHTDDLRVVYSLPTLPAIKTNKDLGISMLQDDVRGGLLKVEKGGHFDEEARFIVFTRDEVTDALTREVDDDIYHGDMSDAVLYAKRALYNAGAVKK